ncbi:hypothetical protein [Psychrobacillus sp. NPDC096389]|uniref:hypothetical protein n=1 Tax=Psychrobacillus sp. NPDC096389 TaxID=3364490 RepID=UPI00381F9F86
MDTQYENRLVAFIDILGFSNHVRNSEKSNISFIELRDILKEIEEYIIKENKIQETQAVMQKHFNNKYNKLEYIQFSDSLIISTPIFNHTSIFSFTLQITYLQAYFLNKGVLLRGGVSYGQIFHQGNICFGPAFIRAYKLENELADVPRIVIDTDLVNGKIIPSTLKEEDIPNYLLSMKSYSEQAPNSMFIKDKNDDLFFINFMLLKKTFKDNRDSIINTFKLKLDELDITNISDAKIYKKIKWLLNTIESHNY